MEIHNLIQGSPEWHAHRANFDNASDAPAMMGCSPYKSREKLVREVATRQPEPISLAARDLFAEGHRTEALARQLAEEIIGEELSPVVGTNGRLSASFDGLTMLGDTGFEHKMLNDALRDAMRPGCTGADLPLPYRVQLEQQCHVSGCERVLFMATKWRGDTLVESRHCWYFPDASLRATIIDGWAQFAADVAAFRPPEVVAEVIGRAPTALPALRIEVSGAVTASNLAEFRGLALKAIGDISTELSTDQHFADAELAVKWCSEVESRLTAAKESALSQTESIATLMRTVDELVQSTRAKRLQLEKLVKEKKDSIRAGLLQAGVKALADSVADLNRSIGWAHTMPAPVADFAGAIKGKRTISGIQAAIDNTLAAAKIAATGTADRIKGNLAALRLQGEEFAHLFPDLSGLALKAADDFAAVVCQRITAERQRQDEAEEKRKAEAKASEEAAAAAAAAQEAARLNATSVAAQSANTVGLAARRATEDAIERAASGAGAPAGRILSFAARRPSEPSAPTPPAAGTIVAELDIDAVLAGALDLSRHVALAFSGRFKSQPKMPATWWEELSRLNDEALPQLQAATEP